MDSSGNIEKNREQQQQKQQQRQQNLRNFEGSVPFIFFGVSGCYILSS